MAACQSTVTGTGSHGGLAARAVAIERRDKTVTTADGEVLPYDKLVLATGSYPFVPGVPEGFTGASTVLPVQVFLWSDEVSRGFVEKTSAAIIVLLVFLLAMNGLAIYLRNRFETRW